MKNSSSRFDTYPFADYVKEMADEDVKTKKKQEDIGIRWYHYKIVKYGMWGTERLVDEKTLQYFDKERKTWFALPTEIDYHYV